MVPAINCTGLARFPRGRGPAHVLSDVDLEVPGGARLGLLGKNGAGKSTLIRLLLGLAPIGEGRAALFGTRVPDPESRQGLGYLPEHAAPFAALTGREHLALHARLEGLADGARAVADGLRWAGLEAAADRLTRHYSKGMSQRLELARIFLAERRLLVLDEPLTGLDTEGRVLLEERLLELAGRGVTMVVTAHDPAFLEKVCSHFAVVKAGRLASSGTRAEVLHDQGWRVEYATEGNVPTPPPPGAAREPGGPTLRFQDRAAAEAELARASGQPGAVVAFGAARRSVDDLLREVVA